MLLSLGMARLQFRPRLVFFVAGAISLCGANRASNEMLFTTSDFAVVPEMMSRVKSASAQHGLVRLVAIPDACARSKRKDSYIFRVRTKDPAIFKPGASVAFGEVSLHSETWPAVRLVPEREAIRICQFSR